MTKHHFQTVGQGAERIEYDNALRDHMLKVYNYMSGGLLLTALVAFLTASTPAMVQLIFGTPLQWVAIFAPLGFIFFISFNVHKMQLSTLQILFWAFAATMGLSIASIFLIYPINSILRVFFITSAMFASMSLYGYTTKKDLQGMGSFMMMGLFGIIIASIVNLFMQSTALDFVVSIIGVIVFTGLTAWDTQKIKEAFDEGYGTELNSKMAIWGALSLYLDFINLFMMLLRLLGDRK